METINQITNEIAISGQLSFSDLQQLAKAGYQAVVNLRSPNEIGFLSSEKQTTEYLGLRYFNFPIQPHHLDLEDLLSVAQKIIDLPKPLLVHCDSGIRSSIIVLLEVALVQGLTGEEALQRVQELGLISE